MTINCSLLSFVGSAVSTDAAGYYFWINELYELLDQDDAERLVLKITTCPILTAHTSLSGFTIKTDPDVSVLPGAQDYVVVAVDSEGTMLPSGLAALPCPPHCDHGGYGWIEFEYFEGMMGYAKTEIITKLRKPELKKIDPVIP